ncbi:MAG: glutathione S-transferase family protein [Myxococcales bacterium]|nr:glutathione S-transferase family protein [Myxococcales bacterium]
MPSPSAALRLFRHPISGHCHRAELLLSILRLPHHLVDVAFGDFPAEVKQHNRFGQIPVLQDGDTFLADSSAILVYLASQYDPSRRWLPTEPRRAAEVTRWLSVAAGPLAYGPAAARVTVLFGRDTDLAPMHAIATRLFNVLELELAQRAFLVGDEPTIADLAHYAYVARAPEGKLSLEPYPGVRAWLRRIEALPGFVPMVATAMPPVAA